MKEGVLIRFLLVALPAGLLALGVASMVSTHVKRKREPADPNETLRLEASALQRRPVNATDLARDLATLSGRIGPRPLEKAPGLESAAFWLESTLGGGNIGYTVERQDLETGGGKYRNLIADLPGSERRQEVVLVGVPYDTPPGSVNHRGEDAAVAALLSLARAFAGEAQKRTVRFAAFSHSADPQLPLEDRGTARYAHRCRSRGEAIVAVLLLDSLEEGNSDTPIRFAGHVESLYQFDSATGAFHHATGREVVAERIPDAERLSAEEPSLAPFQEAGFPAVSVRIGNESRQTDAEPATAETLATTVMGLEAIVRVWANP